MKFTIDRASWRCGGEGPYKNGEGKTYLKNRQGCKCCLGFVSEQLGITNIEDLMEPCDTDTASILALQDNDAWDEKIHVNTQLSTEAMAINDDEKITNDVREAALVDLFARNQHQLVFIGNYNEKVSTTK